MSEELLFTVDTDIAEVGRRVMAEQLAVMALHRPFLLATADVTAVHETRKAMRRTFTAFKLFRPFFQPEALEPYRKHLKKMMKYLGQARDTAVFREKLVAYQTTHHDDFLECLVDYWQKRQDEIDEALRSYMGGQDQEVFWQEYGRFTHTPGLDILPHPDPYAPMSAAHHVPVLIYQRVAGIRAYAHKVADVPLERLHMLRIQGKELRYTLQFFAPILGLEIGSVQATLEQMQEHLGALQDAYVGQQLLRETAGCKTAVELYQGIKAQEIRELVATFPAVWAKVDSATWRRDLAAAIAVL